MNDGKMTIIEVYGVWYQPWWHSTIWYGILSFIVCIVLLVLGFWLYKSGWFRKKLSFKEQVLQDLRYLREQKYTSDQMIRDAYFELTMILKKYFAQHYGIAFLDKTDQEVVAVIQGLVPEQLQMLLAEFFERSFQIKFARDQVLEQMLMDDIAFVQGVIEKISGNFEKMDTI